MSTMIPRYVIQSAPSDPATLVTSQGVSGLPLIWPPFGTSQSVQWTPSNPATLGTSQSVLISDSVGGVIFLHYKGDLILRGPVAYIGT